MRSVSASRWRSADAPLRELLAEALARGPLVGQLAADRPQAHQRDDQADRQHGRERGEQGGRGGHGDSVPPNGVVIHDPNGSSGDSPDGAPAARPPRRRCPFV